MACMWTQRSIGPRLLVALACMASCAPPRGPTIPAHARESNEPCPIVPLRLTIAPSGHPAQTALSVDENGAFRFALGGSSTPFGLLDARGCLVVAGNTEAEALSDGSIWTANARFEFSGSTLRLTPDRSLAIRPDGVVEPRAADGRVDTSQPSTLAFVGYSQRAACAARVMLAVFMAAMPSMAAVDGVLPNVPSPQGSPCPRIAPHDAR